MQFELPAPEALWGRTLVVQVVQDPEGSGQLGELVGGRVTFDMRYRDNWFTLVRYPRGRAVLFGRGRDDTYLAPDQPQDPLAGAPEWVPEADLTPLVLAEEIDFVRWWDSGRWHHAEQLDRLRVEYETAVALYPLLEFDQLVGVFADSLHGVTLDEVERLFAAAEAGAVSKDMVDGLEPALWDAVGDYLTRGGVMAGSAAVTEPLPAPAPGPRPRRRITAAEHRRQLVAAMVGASELPRPTPRDTPELADVIARIEALRDEYGTVEYAYRVGGRVATGTPRTRKIPAGLRRLRAAEAAEYGRWLFIRFRADHAGVRVERAYDHWPSWYPLNPYRNDPDRADIVAELETRPPEWQPVWADTARDAFAQC
ncbi:hypothetical protein [Nocardia sp. NPDC050710]|uniref:hypothetical protein n=1 Tax=Nocardia sp. NPDC050710 TaxID=3157220 RepID=UPI0034062420